MVHRRTPLLYHAIHRHARTRTNEHQIAATNLRCGHLDLTVGQYQQRLLWRHLPQPTHGLARTIRREILHVIADAGEEEDDQRGDVRGLLGVEVVLEGAEEAVDAVLRWLYTGPPAARVESVDVQVEEPQGEAGFTVR